MGDEIVFSEPLNKEAYELLVENIRLTKISCLGIIDEIDGADATAETIMIIKIAVIK